MKTIRVLRIVYGITLFLLLKMVVQRTLYLAKALNADVCNYYYDYLSQNVEWEEGIRSKKGFTRKALSVDPATPLYQELIELIGAAHAKLKETYKESVHNYRVLGIYLNFYENGEMWTPNHSHKGTQQMVISLGGSRSLDVGKRKYVMTNGDAILFGSTVHGVPKEDTVEGRISIATFMAAV